MARKSRRKNRKQKKNTGAQNKQSTPQNSESTGASESKEASSETVKSSAENSDAKSSDSEVKATEAKTESIGTEVAEQVGETKANEVEKNWRSWLPLFDRGMSPIRFPYDHGGVPLFLLLVYMSFLGMSFYYMSRWMMPDFWAYFQN